ncbi:MAG: hypothetical protein GY711_03555 [bacterium]|nr:hypothetical protein [bacterium]
MAWGTLGTQFCLELAFGVFLGLTLIPRAPLGLFFFRMMGTTAVLPLIVAALLPPLYSGASWTNPATVLALVALLAFPFVVGPVKSSKRFWALVWSTLCAGAALVATVWTLPAVEGAVGLTVASLSAMATGVVAGGVGLAMVVGHWYLTVPSLPVSLLSRLNRFTALSMAGSALLVGLTCFLYSESLQSADAPLLGPWGLFYLGARVVVGIVLPLLFAWMTAGSLAYQNTRSATGILYASTVHVLIGTAASLSLQDSYGIPL